MNIDTLGGRKVIVAAVILVVGIGAMLIKGDIPAGMLQLLQVIFGAFVVGNAVEHVTGALGTSSNEVSVPGAELSVPNAAAETSTPVAAPAAQDPNTPLLHSISDAVATVQQTLLTIIQKTGI